MELVIESFDRDSEAMGTFGLIAVMKGQRPQDMVSLDVVERKLDPKAARFNPSLRGTDIKWDIFEPDLIIVGQDLQPLDGVLKLTDVPRPVVIHEDFDDSRVDPLDLLLGVPETRVL